MQPPAPSRYSPALLERTGLLSGLPIAPRLILRHLERRPLATILSITGLALGEAVMVLGTFVGDAVETLGDFQFATVQRFDRAVAFHDPASGSALGELARVPGVTAVEPYRSVAAILRHGHHERREAILGLSPAPALLRIVDRQGRVHEPRDDGLTVSSKLAELLDARPGDVLDVEVLELSRPRLRPREGDGVARRIGHDVGTR